MKKKRKKCKECGKLFVLYNSTQQVCDYKCALEFNKKKKVKDLANVEKWQKEQDLIDWGKKLQVKVNFIVRLIDKGLNCLARNTKAKQFHAGHVYARGGNQTIRFNLHNIHRQSAQSNHYQNDDGLLREGIVNEYGQDYMDFISELRQSKALKLNNNEYKELTKKASKIASKIKKEDKEYSLNERVELRNEINSELKIYENKYCNFKTLKK